MKRLISIVLTLLLLFACAPSKRTAASFPESADVKPVALGFETPEIGGYEDFVCTLSAAVLSGTENKNFSPISAYFALAMAAEGANGRTRQDLLRFMGCRDLDELHALTEQMQKRLTRPTETGELTLCNSLWMGEVFPVKKEYRTQLSERYDATVETVAFGTDAAAKRIADWIAEKTNGLIAPAPEAMDFDPLTIAVLFNTIYFRDQWSRPFGSVQPGTFTRADGTTENAAYLHRLTEDTSVVRGEGFLRYSVWYESKGRIVFVLPDEDVALSDLLGTPEKLQTLLSGGEIVRADVDLELPEFTFSDRFELADVLCALGLRDVFADGADFSGMTSVPTRLDRVVQETVVDLNETGMEAAGYTEVLPAPGEAPMPDETKPPLPLIEFHLNRPFLFVIMGSGGTPLFVGTVENPTH